MRKLFILATMAITAPAILAQCNELFISEYIEGWSNNKAIEIYNPTGSAIDMSDYQLERYSNGATSAQDNQEVVLSGTIEPNADHLAQDFIICGASAFPISTNASTGKSGITD